MTARNLPGALRRFKANAAATKASWTKPLTLRCPLPKLPPLILEIELMW